MYQDRRKGMFLHYLNLKENLFRSALAQSYKISKSINRYSEIITCFHTMGLSLFWIWIWWNPLNSTQLRICLKNFRKGIAFRYDTPYESKIRPVYEKKIYSLNFASLYITCNDCHVITFFNRWLLLQSQAFERGIYEKKSGIASSFNKLIEDSNAKKVDVSFLICFIMNKKQRWEDDTDDHGRDKQRLFFFFKNLFSSTLKLYIFHCWSYQVLLLQVTFICFTL